MSSIAADLAFAAREVEKVHMVAELFDIRQAATRLMAADEIAADEVVADIDALLDAFKLQQVRRFFNQVHWEEESAEATAADHIEPGLRLENVAAHSWCVADAVLVLAPHFPQVDGSRSLSLAVIHDKLEIFTGDFDPVGSDGQGTDSHAFNLRKERQKRAAEYEAMEFYLAKLRPAIRGVQRDLLLECIEAKSQAARFVKAVDRLQALAFVHLKKDGRISDPHLAFSIRYSVKAIAHFEGLRQHYFALADRMLSRVAEVRGISEEALLREISTLL